MSREVIEALAGWTVENNRPLMLIASRNQIEAKLLGGGYVMSTEELGEFVRGLNAPLLKLCRDHSGPYLYRGDRGLDLEWALAQTKQSLMADVSAGFRFLHIDASACGISERSVAEELIRHCKNLDGDLRDGTELAFEYGSEDNVGIAVSEQRFEDDLRFITRLARPTYVVGQTGSLVRRAAQVGTFDPAQARRLVELADRYGTRLKEHNADYLRPHEIELREKAGVGAINIAPELGNVHTATVLDLALQYGLDDQWTAFRTLVVRGENWRKWEAEHIAEKVYSAGHYHFDSAQYADLVGALSGHCDVSREIHAAVKKAVDRYANRA